MWRILWNEPMRYADSGACSVISSINLLFCICEHEAHMSRMFVKGVAFAMRTGLSCWQALNTSFAEVGPCEHSTVLACDAYANLCALPLARMFATSCSPLQERSHGILFCSFHSQLARLSVWGQIVDANMTSMPTGLRCSPPRPWFPR